MEEDGGLNILEDSSDSVNNSLEESFDLDSISEVLGPQHMARSDSPEKNSVEGEKDSYSNTDWVERAGDLRIEEFADLNSGEKTFFKLWNRHVLSLRGVGVAHMSAVVPR